MGVSYNKDFFERMQKRRESLDEVLSEETSNQIAQEIADVGASIASTLYFGKDVSVSSSTAEGGHAEVVADGDQVAYIEFGTGEYAKGTYPGQLPQSGVPITGNWQHYYDNPKTKRTSKSGRKGWFYQKKFYVGNTAGAQMWNTARELHKVKKTIAKEIIQEVLTGGGE